MRLDSCSLFSGTAHQPYLPLRLLFISDNSPSWLEIELLLLFLVDCWLEKAEFSIRLVSFRTPSLSQTDGRGICRLPVTVVVDGGEDSMVDMLTVESCDVLERLMFAILEADLELLLREVEFAEEQPESDAWEEF